MLTSPDWLLHIISDTTVIGSCPYEGLSLQKLLQGSLMIATL